LGIYRGAGGTGDAVADSSSEALLVRELAVEVQADADAAAASAAAALVSENNAETAATNAQTAETNAETAEANAETAQAAAELARNAAQTAQTAAETAETNAETAETNAASSASAAATSASNAASSASSASTSASTATTQASNASTSATNASNSASAAATSATNAANSATAAAGSATTASNSASSAASSESNASTSATNAATSASTATTQAGIATTQATNASNSASAASTSATNAASSATAAAGSATSASSSASTATTQATNAANSATSAATSATNAANSATAAAASAASINLSSIAITGGSINGTTVGATTPSTGKFTTLEYTSTLTGGTGVVNLGSGQFYKDASGNVGIGTTSPTEKLSLTGSSRAAILATGGAVNNYFIADSSSGVAAVGTGTAYPLIFLTSAAERMRIASSGRVGIATNNPQDTLDVAGSATLYYVYPSTDNAYSCGLSTKRWSAVYAVNGTIQTSDERDKTEIVESPLGLDFVKALKPVAYKFKVGKNEVAEDGTVTSIQGTRQHFGFLAQQVKQSIGDVDFGGWILTDTKDAESPQGLRYDEFISPLVKAIQEQQVMIEELKAKVAALEAA